MHLNLRIGISDYISIRKNDMKDVSSVQAMKSKELD